MSGWDNWVDFIVNTSTNDYNEKNNAADHPAAFYVQIGAKTGDIYAAYAGFPNTISANDCKRLGDASVGAETDVFGNPPKGFTIFRPIDCEQTQVLTGKHKGEVAPGISRCLFAGYTTDTLVVALVDITNSSKGLEVAAAIAFGGALCKAMDSGV